MTIVLFEDVHVPRLDPVTLGKPAYAITCGSYRLIDLVLGMGHPVRVIVRPHLREIGRMDLPANGHAPTGPAEPVVMVNARLVPSVEVMTRLKAVIEAGRPGAVHGDESIAAAVLPAASAVPSAEWTAAELATQLGRMSLEPLEASLPLFDYPHDIVRHHLEILTPNLEDRLRGGIYREVGDGLFAAPGATVGDYVVSDTRRGPIVLDEDASIGPYCYLCGPAHLGRGARVIEHAAIKDCVSLGHTTKIGGEVEASIIEPYTNKQHHGFLGHSYLGSWINLGAGTCNSDLKNTYGEVKMEYAGRKVPTGMQFVGCIVGDYAKSAVNTSIFTGKTIGACSMLYGFVTTNVGSFVNYARSFGQVTEVPVEVMVQTQARMFARRNVAQRPCDVQLLHDLFELTQRQRQIVGEPLVL